MKRKLLLLLIMLSLGYLGRGTNLINENIQSWTSHGSYGTYTQAITAGTVNMTACIVAPSGAASGTGSIGYVQMQAANGILELPTLSSVGTAEFHIHAGGAGRTLKLQSYNGSTWTDLTTFTIGATGTTFTYAVNSDASTKLRLATPSAAVYVHDIIITDYIIAPTTQAYNIVFANIQQTQMDASWTNGNGSKRIVKISTSNSFTDPTDGSDPTANAAYGGSGEQVVFNNSGSSVTVTGLTAGTTYYYRVYEYNGTGLGTKYYTATATNNPNSQATSSASTPAITLTGSLSAFAATLIGSTSAEQSYTVSGSNLTADITITPPSGFEISTGTGGSFVATNPVTLSQIAGNVSATTIYVRFAPTAAQSYSGNITHASTDAATQNQAVSGMGIKPEPSNYATSFEATTGSPSYSAAMVDWTDATGDVLPDGYLIKGSTTSYDAITTPVDGTAETDGGLVKNIAQGTGIYEFTGLNANTTYYFKIFSYTNTGNNINYKTDGTIPQSSVTTDTQPVNTYTWNVASGNWNTATSWTPSRTSPLANDILIFDGSVQAASSVTIDFTSPQTIGRLRIINNAAVTFATSDATRTLNIGYAGSTSPQLEVASGSSLTVSAANALTLNVLTGFTGSISGNITFSGTAHRLTAADASGITFNNGSVFTAGTAFSGNAFGTSTANSVVFASGATYIHQAGSNPFALTAPASIIVFQSGSLYKHKSTGSPSMNGRTYANFELDATAFSATLTGSTGVTIDNLSITNCTSIGMNLTGTMNIKGNIIVNSGTLSFSPVSTTTVDLNGLSTQTISGAGTLTIGSNANFVIDNAVIANRDITFGGLLTINSGKTLTINSGKNITVSGTLANSADNSGLVIEDGASLITNGTVSGGATVKRTFTGPAWHLMSPPVDGQSVFTDYTDMYYYDETQALWVNHNGGSWNGGEPSYLPGKGYLVSWALGTTKEFAGTLHSGDYATGSGSVPALTYTSGKGNGFNLVGNPYPSAINGSISSWTKTNVDNSIWVYDNGNYLTWNGSSGTLTGGVIPAMQGFWVKANSSSPSLTIPNSARTASAQAYYKESAQDMLHLQVDGNGYRDGIVVNMNDEATNGYDHAFDVFKMYGDQNAPQMYSLASDNELSINVLPHSAQEIIVPVALKVGQETSYTISVKENTFNPLVGILLEDVKTNNTINLWQVTSYTLTANPNDDPQRFKLHFNGATGINEPSASPFSIYVSNGIVYVNNSDNQMLKGTVTVYSVTGQAITTRSLSGDRLQKLSFNGKPGCYIVRVTTDKGVYSQKIIL